MSVWKGLQWCSITRVTWIFFTYVPIVLINISCSDCLRHCALIQVGPDCCEHRDEMKAEAELILLPTLRDDEGARCNTDTEASSRLQSPALPVFDCRHIKWCIRQTAALPLMCFVETKHLVGDDTGLKSVSCDFWDQMHFFFLSWNRVEIFCSSRRKLSRESEESHRPP